MIWGGHNSAYYTFEVSFSLSKMETVDSSSLIGLKLALNIQVDIKRALSFTELLCKTLYVDA